MKQITEYIIEKKSSDSWIAVSVTTGADHIHKKETTTQRVVSYETYLDMKETGHTKGYMEIVSIEALSPVCSSKEAAMNYIDAPKRDSRKSKIDKGSADYIVWCISSGGMNPSGKTKWDWNFWDEWKDAYIFIDRTGRSFLFGAEGSLKVGDKVCCVDNDTQKKLSGAPYEIKAICKCNIEDFRTTYRKEFPSLCKRESFSFGRKVDGLPWTKMGQIYSIKGISDEA